MTGDNMKMIDISEHNGQISWSKVVTGGVEGVIIRAGYGQGNKDKRFDDNIEGAIASGIKHIGIYWFSYAYTNEMAKREAQYCNDLIMKYKDRIDLPVFFDWEYDSMAYAKKRAVYPKKKNITDMTVIFCERIKELGYKAGYYLNLDYQKNYIDISRLKEYIKWFAYYNESLGNNSCHIWQFTSSGRVSGINGNVDLNNMIEDITGEEQEIEPAPEPDTDIEDDIQDSITDTEEYDMPLIKNGSKGKAVAIWQIIVGVKADGIFGNDTKKATEKFQKNKGLVVDGIVGPKSWKTGLESV